MPRAPLGTVTNVGKETVATWKARLLAAEKLWLEDDTERELIRSIISEEDFPFVMIRDMGPSIPHSTIRKLNPQVDQIDLNLPGRYVQKLVSNAGDEIPELKWSRDWTDGWQEIAHLWDLFAQRVMARSGAPANNAEGAKDICADGVTTYWMGMSFGLPAEDLEQASDSAGEAIERLLADPEKYEPKEGQPHAILADVMESKAWDIQTATNDPTNAVSEALFIGVMKHRVAAAKTREKGPLDWRYDRLQVTHERLPYGTDALADPTTSLWNHGRWVARRCRIPIDDARRHPAFHPTIRKQIQPVPYAGRLRETLQRADGSRSGEVGDTNHELIGGLADIWEIHDRKTKQIVYLDLNLDRFLNPGFTYDKDGKKVSRMRHPFLDEQGLSIITPVDGHPGFFPCDMNAADLPKRDDEKKKHGKPLLRTGLKILLAISKCKSAYVNALKRAATALYEAHPKAGEAAKRAVKMNIDGTVFNRPADVAPGETITPIIWKPPSEELFRQIGELVADWCMVQSFPLGELTTKPVADTVGQEEIGLMSGDVWMLEILRKLEMSYGVQAHISGCLARRFLNKTDWVELVGPEMGEQLYTLLVEKQMALPPQAPSVRYASQRRDAHPIRVKQIMDFDERASTKLNPLTQLPKYDDETWMQEASRSLNLGRLMRYVPDKEFLRMLAEAKGEALAAMFLEQQGQQGGAPDGNGQPSPEGGGGGGGTPPQPAGMPGSSPPAAQDGPMAEAAGEPLATSASPGGSAANDRPKKRRGGRRGRAQGAPDTQGQRTSATRTGPV